MKTLGQTNYDCVEGSTAILIQVQPSNEIISISLGDGLNADSLCEGTDSYLYVEVYRWNGTSFDNVNGGQLDYKESEETYNSNLLTAVDDIFKLLDLNYDDYVLLDYKKGIQ